jgi:hypothetical protein
MADYYAYNNNGNGQQAQNNGYNYPNESLNQQQMY